MCRNRIFSFEHLDDDRAGDHEFNQRLEERALAVNRIETFCFALRQLLHARGNDLETCLFESRIDLTDHVLGNRIGLDNGKGALQRHRCRTFLVGEYRGDMGPGETANPRFSG